MLTYRKMESKFQILVEILSFISASHAYKIWQLADVHLDYRYSATGDVNAWCHEREGFDG